MVSHYPPNQIDMYRPIYKPPARCVDTAPRDTPSIKHSKSPRKRQKTATPEDSTGGLSRSASPVDASAKRDGEIQVKEETTSVHRNELREESTVTADVSDRDEDVRDTSKTKSQPAQPKRMSTLDAVDLAEKWVDGVSTHHYAERRWAGVTTSPSR